MADSKKGRPYRLLWISVLVQAVKDLEGDPRNKNVAKQAAYWFNRNEPDDIGAFVWICELINLDPDLIRKEVFR